MSVLHEDIGLFFHQMHQIYFCGFAMYPFESMTVLPRPVAGVVGSKNSTPWRWVVLPQLCRSYRFHNIIFDSVFGIYYYYIPVTGYSAQPCDCWPGDGTMSRDCSGGRSVDMIQQLTVFRELVRLCMA